MSVKELIESVILCLHVGSNTPGKPLTCEFCEPKRELIAAALRATESSALERAAQVVEEAHQMWRLRDIAQEIRALIPPAAAPKTQRDAPCGGCGHPLWWHQWNSKEHAFCCAPLDELQRDYCRCKNYEKPAAAPAACPTPYRCRAGHHDLCPAAAPAAETGKAQGADLTSEEIWRRGYREGWFCSRDDAASSHPVGFAEPPPDYPYIGVNAIPRAAPPEGSK